MFESELRATSYTTTLDVTVSVWGFFTADRYDRLRVDDRINNAH